MIEGVIYEIGGKSNIKNVKTLMIYKKKLIGATN